jgi:hypothetical protein
VPDDLKRRWPEPWQVTQAQADKYAHYNKERHTIIRGELYLTDCGIQTVWLNEGRVSEKPICPKCSEAFDKFCASIGL